MAVEGTRTTVHGGCQHIGLQTQQQLADLGVGLGADVAQFLLVVLLCPGLQSPVLVVDKDAAILDRRLIRGIVGIDIDGVAMTDGHVGPPVPGRDTHLLTQRKHTIGSTTAVAANDDQAAVDLTDDKLFPATTDLRHVEASFPDESVDIGVVADGGNDDRPLIAFA